MSSISEAYANTENDKKSKLGPGSEKKSAPTTEVKDTDADDYDEAEEAELNINTDESDPSKPPYYQPTYLNQEITSSGEDQNAVLSFNVIQYIFQRFKFSEEVY